MSERTQALQRPTPRELLGEMTAVVRDLPRFVSAPLLRHRHRRWGATDADVAGAMPGDEIIRNPHYEATRAITIDRPPEAVWPWLVQVGCLRAGWYSNDLLDNLGHRSADSVVPELQHVEVGDWVPMSPTPSERTAFRVSGFERGEWMLWEQPVSSWAWRLVRLPDDRTRLLTRLRIRYDWRRPPDALLSVVLNEFGDFPMMRRMLLGIKRRVERETAQGRDAGGQAPASPVT
jgi:hypothetical protein